ncbi:MAG: sugar transferase [Clostridia bacterium]|nr:sugar transferase [Clostridia bacterium]
MEAKESYMPLEYELNGETVFHVVHCRELNGASDRYLAMKRLLDIICSFCSIVVLSFLLFAISVAIRLTSEGPAIYTQKRVGKNGRIFNMYKFRSMVDGAEDLERFLSPEQIEVYETNRKLGNDPRITKAGSLLRKTSLDELPQIFNIIKGDMSFVGPRPMMPEEIEMYGGNFGHYITVKPGLTGLWQINCRSRTRMRDRARLDKKYIENESLGFDISIIFKTLGVVFSKKGAC